MGIDMCFVKAFDTISEKEFEVAFDKLKDINIVIDSGFPVGIGNKRNIDLIKEAICNNKQVFSLREQSESKELYKEFFHEINHVETIDKMIKKLKEK